MAQRIVCDSCGESCRVEENNNRIFPMNFGRRGTDIGDWQGELCVACRKKVTEQLTSLNLKKGGATPKE